MKDINSRQRYNSILHPSKFTFIHLYSIIECFSGVLESFIKVEEK
jgi:hypothetical protein